MEPQIITSENFQLLMNNVDELVKIFNAIVKAKDLPFELLEIRFRETVDNTFDDTKSGESFLPNFEENNFNDLKNRFNFIDERINFKDVKCPDGIDHYECSPITGLCIPICR